MIANYSDNLCNSFVVIYIYKYIYINIYIYNIYTYNG